MHGKSLWPARPVGSEGVLRRELEVQEAHAVRISHCHYVGLPSFQGSITDGDGEWSWNEPSLAASRTQKRGRLWKNGRKGGNKGLKGRETKETIERRRKDMQ